MFAGFVAFVAVSPLNPGSVSTTSSSTNIGGSTAKNVALVGNDFTDASLLLQT